MRPGNELGEAAQPYPRNDPFHRQRKCRRIWNDIVFATAEWPEPSRTQALRLATKELTKGTGLQPEAWLEFNLEVM